MTPLAEDAAYPALPEPGYGEEKLFSEQLCRSFTADYGLATRVARYHNVYGSHGAWTGGREKAPAALCRKVAEAILTGADEIEIWGDGNQTRSFMHVDDCVRGTLLITEGELAEPVNLGSSELVSVNQLADLVEEIAGARFKRRYNLAAQAGVRGRNSDNTLLRSAFGWEPSVPLRDGLARTYGWVYDQVAGGPVSREQPLVVFYNSMFGEWPEPACGQCQPLGRYSADPALLSEADAIVFHLPTLGAAPDVPGWPAASRLVAGEATSRSPPCVTRSSWRSSTCR